MLDFLSTSCFTSRGDVITIAVPGPILREKISPYCFAHSLNLQLWSVWSPLMNSISLLQMSTSRWDLMQVAQDWQCCRTLNAVSKCCAFRFKYATTRWKSSIPSAHEQDGVCKAENGNDSCSIEEPQIHLEVLGFPKNTWEYACLVWH